jgi:hypothetical protein
MSIASDWGSNGLSNEELIQLLKAKDIIQSSKVENAARKIDIKHFVRWISLPSSLYADQVLFSCL